MLFTRRQKYWLGVIGAFLIAIVAVGLWLVYSEPSTMPVPVSRSGTTIRVHVVGRLKRAFAAEPKIGDFIP
jgi:hypothetical protein